MALGKPAYIYCITNTINGKKYVGKTNGPDRRWKDHRSLCNKIDGLQYEKLLYRAMRKYGVDNFTYELLQKYGSDNEALDDEDRWIDKLQSRVSQHGYNCTKGGAGPDRRKAKRKTRKKVFATEETKKKMSKGKTESHKEKRLPWLPRLNELHAQGLTNKQISDETGLAVATIRKWLREIGLRSNQFKLDRQLIAPEVIRLSDTGKTVEEISILSGTSKKSVRRILVERNLPINKHQSGRLKGTLDPKFEAKKQWAIPIIIEMCDQGKGKREIRKRVGMGIHFVARTMREHKASKKQQEDK